MGGPHHGVPALIARRSRTWAVYLRKYEKQAASAKAAKPLAIEEFLVDLRRQNKVALRQPVNLCV